MPDKASDRLIYPSHGYDNLMKIEEEKAGYFQFVSHELRASTWDITESWLRETNADAGSGRLYLSRSPESLINELPTLLGGIAKVIDDPLFLIDLEPGGQLYAVAQQFGRYRQETGYQVSKLLADFSLIRQKTWLFCERIARPHQDNFFELERRLNLAMDMITSVAVDVFCQRSASELIELSGRDKLTGFLHAKAFHERLDNEIAKSKRYRQPLTVIRADIDDFGAYNEAEGRLMGNQLLRQVAREIGAEMRASDEAARLTADEFGLILPTTEIAGAKRAAERIRHRIRRLKRAQDRPVTVSIGAAQFAASNDNREALMHAAQVAMDAARADGGDLIKI